MPASTDNILDLIYELEEADDNADVGATGMSHEQMDTVLDANKGPEVISDPVIKSLKEENEKLRGATLCKVCKQKDVSQAVFQCFWS